ncbi:MAG: glycerophosphodiester phosphodiesterase [Acidimicrobiales bacterium]
MRIFGHGSLEPGNLINSRESFVRLTTLGIDGIELDVRRSADDELVVIHDPNYADGRQVSETAANLRPSGVLLLEEALDTCAGMTINIELKNYPSDTAFDPTERIAHLLLDLLKERNGDDQILVSCFGIDCINRIQRLDPTVQTAHLLISRRPVGEVIAPAIENGHRVIHPYESMINAEFIGACRAADLAVNVWTDDNESVDTITALMAANVDGVITASPKRALRVRDSQV